MSVELAEEKSGVKRYTYGHKFAESVSQWEIEAYFYKRDDKREKSRHTLEKWRHLENMIFLDFPQNGKEYQGHQYWNAAGNDVLTYHPYLRDYVWLWCQNDELLNWGPGGIGKSAGWAAVCYEDYCADPENTTTVLVSTSLEILEDRIWGEVRKLHSHLVHQRGPEYEARTGRIVNSKPPRIELQRAGRKRSGIFCIASPPGDSRENVKRQIGRHNKYTRLLNDEANAVSDAAVDVVDNLGITGSGSIIHVRFANADSWLNRFGHDSTPARLTRSQLYREMPRVWETKHGGLCLFQDGRKNPSIAHKDGPEAGMDAYPFMHSKKDNERLLRKGKDSFTYWVQGIGFIPPGDVKNTVLSEAQILDSGADQTEVFWDSPERIYLWGLDPAYQGDCLCPIVPVECGIRIDENGYKRFTILFHEIHYISRGASSGIMEDIIAGVDGFLSDAPEWDSKKDGEVSRIKHGAIDCTCGQVVVHGGLTTKFGGGMSKIGFNDKRSEMSVSSKNNTPAKEYYKDRWTELWMNAHEFVVHGHVRGMPMKIQEQLSNRRVKQMSTPMQIESKEESEWKGGWDETDAFVTILAKLREELGVHPGMDNPVFKRRAAEASKIRDKRRRDVQRNASKRYSITRGRAGYRRIV